MKLKTKKRLRRLLWPVRCVWAATAVIIAVVGASLAALAYLMLDEPDEAREILKRVF